MEVEILEEWSAKVQGAIADERQMEELVHQNEQFILKCAVAASKRFVTKSDDEWSIALTAFCQAVKSYQSEKGAFLSFADLVIRRRLVDYYKSQERHKAEIPAAPEVFESGPLEESEQPALQAAVAKKVVSQDNSDLRFEIEAASGVFAGYGFSFYELASCSPKAEKTKAACARAVACLLSNPVLLKSLKSTKQLPIKTIEKTAEVPRKILDRHRKYIIAAAEILSGDYPGLAYYMRFIRKEMKG